MSEVLSLYKGLVSRPGPRPLPRQIIAEVAARHDLTLADLTGPSRYARVVRARQEAMWELRRRTRLSLAQIAHRLNRKDHTSVLHGLRRHAELSGEGA